MEKQGSCYGFDTIGDRNTDRWGLFSAWCWLSRLRRWRCRRMKSVKAARGAARINCGACGIPAATAMPRLAKARQSRGFALREGGGRGFDGLNPGVESGGVENKIATVKCGGGTNLQTGSWNTGLATRAAADRFTAASRRALTAVLVTATAPRFAITARLSLKTAGADRPEACRATKCVAACPKSIIEMIPPRAGVRVPAPTARRCARRAASAVSVARDVRRPASTTRFTCRIFWRGLTSENASAAAPARCLPGRLH